MTGDCHVRFCGSPGVRFPRATQLREGVSMSERYELIDTERDTRGDTGERK